MSFNQFFRIIWARKMIIILAMAACLVAALGAAALMPKRYEATARVMMDIVKPDPVTGQVLASQYVRAYANTQIELIMDYPVAGKAVDKLGWAASPELAERYAERAETNTQDFRRWLAQALIDNTQVSVIQGSNIIEIHYSAGSPEAARRGADALQQAYVEQTVAFRREDAMADREWFFDQAAKLKGQLSEAQSRKTAFERKHNIVLTEDDSDSEEQRLKALVSSHEPVYAGYHAAVQVGRENTDLARIEGEIATATRTLGPNHPRLIALRAQRDAVAAAFRSTRSTPTASVPSGPSISSQISSQTQKVLAQRGLVNEAQQLSAEVTSLRNAYQTALDKTAELEQLGDSTESSLTPLGNAVAPESAAFPNYPLMFIGALALGGVLGLLAGIIVELLNRRVRGTEDLFQIGVPAIGFMAHGEAKPQRNFFDKPFARDEKMAEMPA